MANIICKVPVKLEWKSTDRLRLRIGTENAANLAASDPAGGSVKTSVSPWPDDATRGGLGTGPLGLEPLGYSTIGYGLGEGELGYGALGLNDVPRAVLKFDYAPVDVCASLPVGVDIVSQEGNASVVSEGTVQLSDPPQGARNLQVTSTGSANEARLTFKASKHVTA